MLGHHCSLAFYQHSSSQKGSAVSESRCWAPIVHLCFISTPAPREDLQQVNSDVWPPLFTCVLSAFQLSERAAESESRRWASIVHLRFIGTPAPIYALQSVNPDVGPTPFTYVLLARHLPERICNSFLDSLLPSLPHCCPTEP